jgi:hypothetical protein
VRHQVCTQPAALQLVSNGPPAAWVKAEYDNVQMCGHALQIGHLEVEALRLLAELHLQCYTANGNKMDATAALSLFTEAYPRLCDLQSCDINQGVPDEVLHVMEQVCNFPRMASEPAWLRNLTALRRAACLCSVWTFVVA